ncbi:MAG: HAD family phosphatase [Eubacterium sp.]|nr:HAD family phosphatase [Eubacterium sp.]
MIRLIAFDMDGTLLNEKKKIDLETKKVLERAAACGIILLPATGRPFCGVSEELSGLKGLKYILTTNGAGIYDWETGQCIHEDSMPLEQFLPLLERLEPLEVMSDAFVKGGSYMSEKNMKLIDEMDVSPEIKRYIRNSRTCVVNQTEYLREKGDDVEKLTINFVPDSKGGKRDYDKVVDILKDFPEFNAVSGGMHNIEVTGKNISKASGLSWLAHKLGIRREEIIAFGDSGNDADMLRYAGIGIAMGNAEPIAIEAADYVTKKNTENGIAWALKQYMPELFGKDME